MQFNGNVLNEHIFPSYRVRLTKLSTRSFASTSFSSCSSSRQDCNRSRNFTQFSVSKRYAFATGFIVMTAYEGRIQLIVQQQNVDRFFHVDNSFCLTNRGFVHTSRYAPVDIPHEDLFTYLSANFAFNKSKLVAIDAPTGKRCTYQELHDENLGGGGGGRGGTRGSGSGAGF